MSLSPVCDPYPSEKPEVGFASTAASSRHRHGPSLYPRQVQVLGSVLFWLFVLLTSLLMFPLAVVLWLLTLPFGPRRVLLHRFTCFWASLYTWCNPLWRVRIEGKANIRPGQEYVLVANHLSIADILVLFRLFVDFKWVSKAEVFRAPLIGWNMALNGYVPVRRGERASVAKMMTACRRALRTGSSLMIFPEGTWSVDGKLRPFKPGAFELAHEEGVAIVPIVIRGSGDAMPATGFTIRGRCQISVTVLPEVPVTTVESMAPTELAGVVRELITSEQQRR